MLEEKKDWKWLVISLAFAIITVVATYFGVTLPAVPQAAVPAAAMEVGAPAEALATPDWSGARERIAIDARSDSFLYNGADLYVYSDNHNTQKLHFDGATGDIDSEGGLDVADSSTFAGITVGGTGITINSMVFTYTEAVTISGILTDVRLLYYQVP